MVHSPVQAEVAPWSPPHQGARRGFVARVVQLVGAFNVVSGILPPARGRIAAVQEYLPISGILSARAAAIAAGCLLIYLGAGLGRGKRKAWQLAVGLAAASSVLHIVKGLDFDAAAASIVLLVLLVVTRHRFEALDDPRTRWRALRVFAGFASTGFLLGFLEIALRSDRIVGHPSWTRWVEQAFLGLAGFPGPLRFDDTLAGDTVSVTTGGFGLLAVGAAVVLLLRPGTRIPGRTDADDQRVRGLLKQQSPADSLGYFALRHDKSLIWSPAGTAVIAYRVVGGVSLAAGDPIGDSRDWPQAIAVWITDCARHGWAPAVLGCSSSGATAYRQAGFDVVELGDEAIVDVASFTLTGRPMRSVRQAVARIDRAGYHHRITRSRDLSALERTDLVSAASALRAGAIERGFSMALSRLGDPGDGDCLIVTCRDDQGRLRGLLQFVPWGADGLSLDLMRRDRTSENGVTESMITAVLRAAPGLGIRRISLNFAVLRSVFARAEQLGAGPVARILARMLRLMSRFWQLESLYRANAKYQPTWQPRYLCFHTVRDLPRIAVSALKAEAFLPMGREAGAVSSDPGLTAEGTVTVTEPR